MDHLANAASLAQAQERLHELGVPRMSATDKVDEEWTEAEKAFADLEAELDAQPLGGIFSRWTQDPNPVAGIISRQDKEIPPVSVTCIKPNARIKCNAPDDSKYRQEYSFSIGEAEAKRDCWHWWRDPNDGNIRILGGRKGSKVPTIYKVILKRCCRLSFEQDEDQSKAMELYNKYGRK